MSQSFYGYVAIFFAAFLWGVSGTVVKSLFNMGIEPMALLKIRMLLSTLAAFALLFCYDRRLLYIKSKDIAYFCKLGVFGLLGVQCFYFLAIGFLNVATAVFLEYLAPAFVALYVYFFEGEVLGYQRSLAVVIAMMGGLLILLGKGAIASLNWWGVLVGLISAVCFSFTTIYGRYASNNYNSFTVITYCLLFGTIFLLLIPPYDWQLVAIMAAPLWKIVYLILFSTIMPYALYYFSLGFLPSTTVSVACCLEPVVAAVVAFCVLNEKMGALEIFGAVCVLLAIILLQTKRAKIVEEGV